MSVETEVKVIDAWSREGTEIESPAIPWYKQTLDDPRFSRKLPSSNNSDTIQPSNRYYGCIKD